MPYTDEYVHHLEQGPFPGRIDPWAEDPRYFQQIHPELISALLSTLRFPLVQQGYVIGREASLLIMERTEPDVFVYQPASQPSAPSSRMDTWSYAEAAQTVQLDPGLAVNVEYPDSDAIFIKKTDTNRLITVIEVISPTNKVKTEEMLHYEVRRKNLVQEQRVNVVELDFTRSVKRLVAGILSRVNHYQIVIHLPDEAARLIGFEYLEPIPSFALPLDKAVIPLRMQELYDFAYHNATVTAQMDAETHYTPNNLPFPSTLSAASREDANQRVNNWLTKLHQLRQSS